MLFVNKLVLQNSIALAHVGPDRSTELEVAGEEIARERRERKPREMLGALGAPSAGVEQRPAVSDMDFKPDRDRASQFDI